MPIDAKKIDPLFFLRCLQVATTNTLYNNLNFKPKQVICLESLFLDRDTLAVLPTGYGKSVIFHLLPNLLKLRNVHIAGNASQSTIILVVSPLNSLMKDQISILKRSNIEAAILNMKEVKQTADTDQEDAQIQLDTDADRNDLKKGKYSILFGHPEAFLSCKEGSNLLQSEVYYRHVNAVVIDEAHCIMEWGNDFRTDYSLLGRMSAIFPKCPIFALTATATKKDQACIMKSLCMNNVNVVVGDLDRPNIFIEKYFRGSKEEAMESILSPVIQGLQEQHVNYPITIIYLTLRYCGYAYRLFEHKLGNKQYFPEGAEPIPKNRLFAQYHAPQTEMMKEEIMAQLSSAQSNIRVIFATVAIGMGVNIPNIRHIIHVGVPGSMTQYYQEVGRCGREGKPSKATLYYNNRDIAKNKVGMTDNVREYCRSTSKCLRKQILNFLDAPQTRPIFPAHLCCSVCQDSCSCTNCDLCRQVTSLQSQLSDNIN